MVLNLGSAGDQSKLRIVIENNETIFKYDNLSIKYGILIKLTVNLKFIIESDFQLHIDIDK